MRLRLRGCACWLPNSRCSCSCGAAHLSAIIPVVWLPDARQPQQQQAEHERQGQNSSPPLWMAPSARADFEFESGR
jgi:hypothetical protein